MNLYLDASALVKRYLDEPGMRETRDAIAEAAITATTLVSRAEVVSAFAKTVRTGAVEREDAISALELFRGDWPDYARLEVSQATVARADALAWEDDLRGYDAVQLATSLVWKEALSEDVHFATFDLQLWKTAGRHPVVPFPDDLPSILAFWQAP